MVRNPAGAKRLITALALLSGVLSVMQRPAEAEALAEACSATASVAPGGVVGCSFGCYVGLPFEARQTIKVTMTAANDATGIYTADAHCGGAVAHCRAQFAEGCEGNSPKEVFFNQDPPPAPNCTAVNSSAATRTLTVSCNEAGTWEMASIVVNGTITTSFPLFYTYLFTPIVDAQWAFSGSCLATYSTSAVGVASVAAPCSLGLGGVLKPKVTGPSCGWADGRFSGNLTIGSPAVAQMSLYDGTLDWTSERLILTSFASGSLRNVMAGTGSMIPAVGESCVAGSNNFATAFGMVITGSQAP